MVFLLSHDGRDDDFPVGVNRAFERYRDYLKANQAAFPPRAYELGTRIGFTTQEIIAAHMMRG